MITNYLSPVNFQLLVDTIPMATEYNSNNLVNDSKVPNAKRLQAALYTQYCMALRVSELLTLKKANFDFENHRLILENTKTGYKMKKGKKVRKKQFTSIPPDFPKWVVDWIKQMGDNLLFPYTRQLIWKYYKQASQLAGLEIAEQQDERFIKGAWTHLIRKSRAKRMLELGAPEVMVKVKLRHHLDVTDRYTRPDINGLIAWEQEHIIRGSVINA